jgi:hypothetical protein
VSNEVEQALPRELIRVPVVVDLASLGDFCPLQKSETFCAASMSGPSLVHGTVRFGAAAPLSRPGGGQPIQPCRRVQILDPPFAAESRADQIRRLLKGGQNQSSFTGFSQRL